MKFHRERDQYFGRDDVYEYVLGREQDNPAGKWRLVVKELTTTAGIVHALGQPVIAEAYDDTKEDLLGALRLFQGLAEGGLPTYMVKQMLIKAQCDYINEIVDQRRAEFDRLRNL